jgi:hypothetical protein
MTYDDELLATWLGSDSSAGPEQGLERALAGARGLRQRPAWLVTLTGGTIAEGPQTSLVRFAAVGVALVALVGLAIGALAVGGFLPRPQPAPSVVASASGEPSTQASAAPSVQPSEPPAQLVAYKRTDMLEPGEGDCTEDAPGHWCLLERIWIARADGSHARLLHPDVFEGEGLYGWMPDGSGLLIADAQSPIVLVGTDGGVIGRWGEDLLCPSPCAAIRDPRVSPDGSRIAFVRQSGNEREGSVLAILDLATSSVIELEATRVTNPTSDCWSGAACPGLNEDPQWSPDGSRLAFSRQVMSPEDRETGPRTTAAVYVVGADGQGLQRVTPTDWFGFRARWSPDGSRLVVTHVPDRELTQTDIYTLRPDGSELAALTDDGRSQLAEWTSDGRMVFVRFDRIDGSSFSTHWVMDADGRDLQQVPTELHELTAIGCVVCVSAEAGTENPLAYWQPMP